MKEGTELRTVIVTSNFWPERTGIGQVITEFARYLADSGIDVHVVTAMPYYPEWSIYPKYRGKLLVKEDYGGVNICRAWHLTRPAPGPLSRIAHELSLCVAVIPYLIRSLKGTKTAFVVSPDLSLALIALLVARLMGVRCVLMVQDVMPDAAIELGMLRNPAVIAVSRWMARCAYTFAHEIYTLGNGMRRRIAKDTNDPEKIKIVPNTIDAKELEAGADQGRPFRDRFVPSGCFAVVHAGNMGKKQDLDLILGAAQLLRDESDIRFLVFGDGAVKDAFLEKMRKAELTNVSHFPFQERDLLPHMLYGADVLLVSQLPEVVDIVVPSKLVTAMGAGAMIISACANDSETARLVRDSNGGIVVPASDEAALAAAILDVRDGRVDIDVCRRNARAFAVRVFDRDAVYGPLAEDLQAPR